MIRYRSKKIFQLREIAIGLTFIGGFIDAYTFVQRGGILAAGQTGNIIFLSIDIANRNLPGALTKMMTMIFFILGIIVATWLRHRTQRTHYWRMTSLSIEFVACVIVGFMPKTVPNLFITPLLSFAMAMQNIQFDQIAGNSYNNVFSTGNLKKSIINLTDYFFSGDKSQLKIGLLYIELVIGFACGAVISALLQSIFKTRTIWITCVLLVLVGGYYMYLLHLREIDIDY